MFLFIGCVFFIKTIAQTSNGIPPNIILIIGDDISRDDIGAYGKNPYIKTPNLNLLAEKGFLLNRFFVTSSSCSPSRTSLITGRYPHNTGAPELHLPLPAEQVYFPELLKKNGYYTALAGKWHEGENTRRAYNTLTTGVPSNGDGGEDKWLEVLKNRPKNKPFFFWLATFDAHREWDNEPRFAHSPDSVLIPPTLVDKPATRADLASYYSEIERLDFNVGLLTKQLEEEGIANNTIIIFLGDNGRPFPGDKTRLLDRGTNTPFILYIPALTDKHRTIDALVSSIDVAPTILDLAGRPQDERMQGKSFLSILKNGNKYFRNYIFTEHNWHDYQAYERGVRTKDYLYIKNWLPQYANQGPLDAVNSPSFKDLLAAKATTKLNLLQQDIFVQPRAEEELYRSEDTLQEINIAAEKKYQKELKSLRAQLASWQKETGDDFPDTLTKDWYGRVNGEILPEKDKRGVPPGKNSNAAGNNKKGVF